MELSDKTRQALAAGRKIDAIKQVREETGLGLKEAKELVEIHLATNPDLCHPPVPMSAGQKTLFYLVFGGALCALGYWLLVPA